MQRIERDVQAGNSTVRLAGRDLQIKGAVQEVDLARFPGKVTFGDYSMDSDSLLSVFIMSSFIGGIGSEHLKEGVDDENYWTGTLETRYPGMVTLLAETHRFSGPDGSASRSYPIADFPGRSPSLYCAFGTTLAKWNEVDREFVSVGTMPSEPANKGVEFDARLWIPLGLGGYATLDDAGDLQIHTDLNVVAFTLWDHKILAITSEGVLRIRDAFANAWEDDAPGLHLPSGHIPRNILSYINSQQEPTVHVITNRDVWAYDRDHARLVRTQLQYPRHPDQGLASTVWRGESMYVSVGLGIHSYNGGIIGSVGPDHRYGLPADLRGRIVDLEPEYNNLIAVVEGALVSDDADQDVHLMRPTYIDEMRPFKDYSAYSTVLRWSNYGWHPVWTSPARDGLPTWALVSIADNTYRLWWGYAGDMLYQDLRTTFHTPKAGMQVGVDRFAPNGRLVTGWMDMDMTGFDKLASHVEVNTVDVFSDGTPTGEITVEYQVDTDPSWYLLGRCNCVGRSVLPFNEVVRESRDDFSAGLRFQRIRLRISMASSNPTHSPVLESILLKFVKIPLSGKSWTLNVLLNQERTFMGNGPRDTAEFLRLLAADGEFHEMIHQNQAYRVRVAQTQMAQATGHDPRATMAVSVVEVPLGREQLKAAPVGTP